jgi:tetratricopeptide (TPR) repeat protein
MAQLKVFVSHSAADNAFCDALVRALRGAGADVWYDEQNLGPGVLRREIMRELADRPIFLVVLSKAAFASSWVQDECEWAYNIYRRKPERLMLPVVAAPYDADDFDTLLYIESMRRVEAADHAPLPQDSAIERTMRLLMLTPAGSRPAPTTPQPAESVDDLLAKGKALIAKIQYAEALPFFERATQRDPNCFDAWANLGYLRGEFKHWPESLAALNRALTLNTDDAAIWYNRGVVLANLDRNDEALAAFDLALTLDQGLANAWYNKGTVLGKLKRYDEALAAFDRALALDPRKAVAWGNKGSVLLRLKEYQEALAVVDRALAIDPSIVSNWSIKAKALRGLGRMAEADEAERRAKELGAKT